MKSSPKAGFGDLDSFGSISLSSAHFLWNKMLGALPSPAVLAVTFLLALRGDLFCTPSVTWQLSCN